MRTLTKFFVAMSLTIVGLCYTPKPAKADLLGIADGALLVQQVMQFIQDWDISSLADGNFAELIHDIKKKSDQVKKIVNIFNNGQQGFAVFNNIVNCMKSIDRTARYLDSYVSYIGNIGDDFELDRCYYIYRQFQRKTNAVLTSLNKSIKDLQKVGESGDTDGPGMLTVINDVISKASSTLDTISNECISDLGEVIHENKMRKQAASVNEIVNVTII